MKVEFKNIGAIDSAKIDLSKDLIIFCGPNNTGKTYVSNAIYALYKYRNVGFTGDAEMANKLETLLSDGQSNLLIEAEFVKRLLSNRNQNVTSYLPSVFATNQKFFANCIINLSITDKEINKVIKSFEMNAGFSIGNFTISYKKPQNENSIKILFTEEFNENSSRVSVSRKVILNILIDRISDDIIDAFFQNAYITPAERTAINIFSKELSVKRNEIVDRLLEYKSNKSHSNPLNEIQRYPLPIRDSLEVAEDLSNLQKRISDYSFLADQIENEILKGKVNVSSNGDVQFTPTGNKVKNLSIHLSASIVKSLSNLVFYFRHLAKKNDFIIIDEPELNLHPDNQIIMARLIARIVNNGFKVLISTHSDYIIKELNNLIRLRSVEDNLLIERYNYKKEDLLDKDKLGVYLFKNRKANSIHVDEFGFEVLTVQRENSQLAEISENIYFELFDKNN